MCTQKLLYYKFLAVGRYAVVLEFPFWLDVFQMMQHGFNAEHSFMRSFFWNSIYELQAKKWFKVVVVVELPLFMGSSDLTVSRDKANHNTKT
jgi:hypothetical protein